MMLKDWLLLTLLSSIGLVCLVILVDHIRTEVEWYRWYRNQNRRNKQ